ncbi:hypothetical protein JCM10213_005321 [Rhodosporidiobolus nylandii]
MSTSSPSDRFRAALASSTSSSPSLDRLVRLADRLPSTSTGDPDIRNTDPQSRQTSLLIAAARGRADVVDWLLDEGHDEDEVSRDAAGTTVLHLAASFGFVDIANLYLARYPFVVEWVNSRGQTPLHVAAMKGEAEVAQLLVDQGADINAPDLDGSTPLHYASSYGRRSVVKLLIDLDCQTDAKNNQGFSAADYAYSFSLLQELESLIREHLAQLKEARRASRAQRKLSKSASVAQQTLRSKRKGSSSALSIALPPMPSPSTTPDAFTSPSPLPDSATTADTAPPTGAGQSGFGLGLSYPLRAPDLSMGTTSPPLGAGSTLGMPTLGAPVPPTPAPLSPDSSYSPSAIRAGPYPSASAPASPFEAPSTPRTPISPRSYPAQNTTSPQPSPSPSTPASLPPSPAGIVRATTPQRSPLSLRRIGRGRSASSPLSTPTSTTARAEADLLRPSPASAVSANSASSGAHTATPTPASPTPVSPRSRAPSRRRTNSSLGSTQLPVVQQGVELQHPVAVLPPPAALAGLETRARSASNATTSSVATSASGHLLPPSIPTLAPAPSPPLASPSRAGGHKLIRKSRSHAHHPSTASTSLDGLAPPVGLGAGVRSVSGPPTAGRDSVDSARSTPLLGRPSGGWLRDPSDEGGAGGRKLRKEQSGSHSALSGFRLGRRESASEGSSSVATGGSKEGKASRFSKVFGLGKK